jgi:hypothetical protein
LRQRKTAAPCCEQRKTQKVAQAWINPRFHFAPCVALRHYEAARRCKNILKVFGAVDDDQFSQDR